MPQSSTSLDSCRKVVAELVERYRRNREHYESPLYNEETARQEFINPFFEALGWDLANEQGAAAQYREVIHEEGIKVGDFTKAPDYTFRIGGQRKFFVEAKKPAVRLETDPLPAYQLRRYAWSAHLPLSILTDFAEFAVYDTRIRPREQDKASHARILFFKCEEYSEHLEEIWNIFSKIAVLQGSFDRYAEETRGKRGTSEVDGEFLQEIESWRVELAKTIALRNPKLSVEEMNFAVQQTIDRILFLRIAEGRGVESYGRLQALVNGERVYPRLMQLFDEADRRYNSGLFDFRADLLTPKLKIDDKVLKAILGNLYYPQSPYEFSLLPAEILGNVYEQFLGKVIRLTAGHQARVEAKPEVKKAGGVYYTPSYIVDYIVGQTVGKLVEGKSPKEMAKLRILDPACGSGSFLLAAYQQLLDAHLAWYRDHQPKKHPEAVFFSQSPGGGDWSLTTAERRRIVLNSIYGVDIDRQAVEVTKLSLLLRVLEGKGQIALGERALPSLEKNIQCGNSLIGPDAFAGELFLDPEDQKRINPFDWETAFPEIFKQGGFDAVIGNPPYGYMIAAPEQEYFDRHFRHQDYQKDLYLLFLERYESLTRHSGLLGVIVSNTWLQSVNLVRIRAHLATAYTWLRVLLPKDRVFRAVVDTCVLIFQKSDGHDKRRGSLEVETLVGREIVPLHRLPRSLIPDDGRPINVALGPEQQKLFAAIAGRSVPLASLCEVFNGVKLFETGKGTPPQTDVTVRQKPFLFEGLRPGKEWAPLLRGSLIQRYTTLWNKNYWVKYGPWLAAPRDPAIFAASEKIMVRQTGDSIIATLIGVGFVAMNNIHILLPKHDVPSVHYFLGVIDSRLISFAYQVMNPEKGEALAEVKKHHVEQLPIHPIDFSKPAEKAAHDQMVALVERMLDLHKRKAAVKTPHDRTALERQIESTDREIDRLVYQLYDLTPEEIALVEKSAGS